MFFSQSFRKCDFFYFARDISESNRIVGFECFRSGNLSDFSNEENQESTEKLRPHVELVKELTTNFDKSKLIGGKSLFGVSIAVESSYKSLSLDLQDFLLND